MQRGSLSIVIRKEGLAVWQFRWSDHKKVQRTFHRWQCRNRWCRRCCPTEPRVKFFHGSFLS